MEKQMKNEVVLGNEGSVDRLNGSLYGDMLEGKCFRLCYYYSESEDNWSTFVFRLRLSVLFSVWFRFDFFSVEE